LCLSIAKSVWRCFSATDWLLADAGMVRTQIGMFRPIRMDHTNCLQVAIKTHHHLRIWDWATSKGVWHEWCSYELTDGSSLSTFFLPIQRCVEKKSFPPILLHGILILVDRGNRFGAKFPEIG
jgi:hypothetical protein